MHLPIIILVIFIVCPILALLFIVRIACAFFSKKVASQIRKHPIYNGAWGCLALVGILAFIRAFTPSNPNPYDDAPRYKLSSWYVLPPVRLLPPIRAEYGSFYCVATEAPIAVSAGNDFLQVWKLGGLFQGPTSPLKLVDGIKSLEGYEHPIAISPDGNIIVIATEYELSVVDWKSKNVLWTTDALEHEGYMGKHLAIGDNGKTLFAAGAHTIERWDLLSGEHHAVLFTNEIDTHEVVRFLKISSNGKVLIAGFGPPNGTGPLSFAVWEVAKNEPAFKSEEKDGMSVDISPDGDWLALSKFGTKNLWLLKWRTGEKKEVALQAPNTITSVLWSPDGKRLAAHVDSWPASIIVYDTSNWKPITHWKCPYPDGIYYEFFFGNNGDLYQVRGKELNAIDTSGLKATGAD
ncbi:MAG: WD40 repeat domain-containing protein [Limisphaerales bacterium]